MRRPRLRFTGQLLLLQLAVVTAVVGLGFSLFGTLLDRQLSTEYGQRALAVARSTAENPVVRDAVARWAADDRAAPETGTELATGAVQQQAEAVRGRTGALFVVVTDDRGIRLAHPDPTQLGRPVSTDPSVPLAGGEEVVEQRGTLGESARAKVPVFAPDGSGVVVGAVSVGIDADVLASALRADLLIAAGYAAAALGLGTVASVLLGRRLRRLTLGLEPEEMAGLVSEHEAVLGGIAGAVVAVDATGRITVANDEARRLLGARIGPGRTLDDADVPAPLRHAISDRLRTAAPTTAPIDQPLLVVTGGRVLVCSVRPVSRGARDLGVVLSARDRTEIESLTRQLDAVQTMSSALRAQRHEFANRLHVVHGLIAAGRSVEADEYVRTLLGSGPLGTLLDGLEAVRDPSVQAFLSAKAAHFRERAVDLRIGAQTWLPELVTDPVAVTTVLGNLLDNAIDAAVDAATTERGPVPDRWVDVELLSDAGTLYVTVADSGPGVPEALRERLFEPEVTGHPIGSGRGLGLSLVRQVARATGGDVWLAEPGGDGSAGAVFVARLPGVLASRGGATAGPVGRPAGSPQTEASWR
ncbi:sensor histidine kinase [Nakamurella leprariae]|uniref:histidine kinase n=1 Tax=Nakamurella leprariae TaxID=2803911 RepID=A0A938YI29_9ACTN|nr:ATP-binding protein [Nakamurella leprariae]MBM9468554.1 Spo0B domain-containing protein [Nakamurella leprariae]